MRACLTITKLGSEAGLRQGGRDMGRLVGRQGDGETYR